MSGSLDDLTAQVSQNTSVIQSAVTLIQGFAQRLEDAGTDPTKLQDLRNQLQTADQQLAAAVAANTPAQATEPGSQGTASSSAGGATSGGATSSPDPSSAAGQTAAPTGDGSSTPA